MHTYKQKTEVSIVQQETVYQFLKLCVSVCVCLYVYVCGIETVFYSAAQAGQLETHHMALDSQQPFHPSFPCAEIADMSHLTLSHFSTAGGRSSLAEWLTSRHGGLRFNP